MEKAQLKKPLSLGEKASIIWLVLFTCAASFSHILLTQGKQVNAFPEIAYLPPFNSLIHFLGTDHLGRNVFYYLLLSCRTAWLLAFPPLGFATLIGVIVGTGAALLGNEGLRISVAKFLFLVILLISYSAIFFIVHLWPPFLDHSIVRWVYYGSGIFLLYFILNHKTSPTFHKKKKTITIAVDDLLQRVIDVWSTFPKLLLLIILTTLTPFSIYTLMGWIAATYWVLPARIARASVLQIKNEVYYETTQALGIPFKRVFTHFIIPHLKRPILTNFCFAASGLLGVGSTLAFLGIGIPPDVPSWGKMIANARLSVDAWWLLVFPAAFLLFSIFSLQVLGLRFSLSTKVESVTK